MIDRERARAMAAQVLQYPVPSGPPARCSVCGNTVTRGQPCPYCLNDIATLLRKFADGELVEKDQPANYPGVTVNPLPPNFRPTR